MKNVLEHKKCNDKLCECKNKNGKKRIEVNYNWIFMYLILWLQYFIKEKYEKEIWNMKMEIKKMKKENKKIKRMIKIIYKNKCKK